MKYTIEELKHLRNIRALGLNDTLRDDYYCTERESFNSITDSFFEWLNKIERRGRISDLLNRPKQT